MKVYAQVVGIGTPDSCPSVMIVTDTCRYLFNVGEGLQRFCMEHKLRLAKLEHIFFTRASVDTCGGLPGMLLTVADMGRKDVKLHGPTGLADYMFGLRNFMRRDDVVAHVYEANCVEQPGQHMLGDLAVTPIALAADDELHAFRQLAHEELASIQSTSRHAVQVTEKDGCIELSEPFAPLRLSTWPSAKGKTRPILPAALAAEIPSHHTSTRSKRLAMSYIIETPTVAGKFHPEKAADFGIKPGPVFGRLSKGEAITATVDIATAIKYGFDVSTLVVTRGKLPKETEEKDLVSVTVTSAHVKSPDTPGQVLAVFDIPTLEYLNNMLECKTMHPFLALDGSVPRKSMVVAYHFCDEVVWETAEYQHFLRLFDVSTQHVHCGHVKLDAKADDVAARCPILNRAQAVQLCKLHVADASAFALPFPLNNSFANLRRDLGLAAETLRSDPHITADSKESAGINEATSQSDLQVLADWRWAHPLAGGASATAACEAAQPPLRIHHLVPLHLAAANPDDSMVLKEVHPFEALDEMAATPGLIETLNLRAPALEPHKPIWPKHLDITFTGTSSAIPSKYRNVSGIYCSLLAEDALRHGFLLDGGEGTIGQLFRRFGSTEAFYEAVKNVKLIWISHMHADHHLGIIKFIKLRSRARGKTDNDPVLVVGPSRLYNWLVEASRIDAELVHAWKFVDAEYFLCLPTQLPEEEGTVQMRPDVTCWSSAGAKRASDASDTACPAKRPRMEDGSGVRPLIDPCIFQPRCLLAPVPLPDETDSFRADIKFIASALSFLNIISMRAVRVQHCFKAYAIKIVFRAEDGGNFSIVYSGDTRPCEEVVHLAKGSIHRPDGSILRDVFGEAESCCKIPACEDCTLVIHEATFDDTDENGPANAVMKKHSTVDEACAVASACNAEFTLLTHFSARYPKLPTLKQSAGHVVFVAYDLMTVNENIHALPSLLPSLHLMFAEEEEADDDIPPDTKQ